MDSQPSQSRLRSTDSADGTTVTIPNVVRLVRSGNQSRDSERSKMIDEQVNRSSHGPPGSSARAGVQWPEGETEVGSSNTKSITNRTQDHTVPETNSEARAGIAISSSTPNRDRSPDKESTITTKTHFETAPTHADVPGLLQSSQISSPIHTTPPGQRRRRRMMDISAEPSPRKMHSQPSFDAQAVLQLDEDEEAADMLESSPDRRTTVPHNRTVNSSKPRRVMPLGSPDPVSEHLAHDSTDTSLLDKNQLDPYGTAFSHSLDLSQEVVRPGRRGHSQPGSKHQGHLDEQNCSSPATDRASIFDIQASPQSSNKTGPQLISKSKNASSVRRAKSTLGSRLSRLDQRLEAGSVHEQIPSSAVDTGHSRTTGQKSGMGEIGNAQSELLLEPIVAPNMVLAYYKGEPRGYYPARVLSSTVNGGFRIQWQDYDPADVDAYGIKALDLHVGDTIKVLADGFARVPYQIHGFKDKLVDLGDVVTDIRGYKTLVISPKQRKSLPSGIVRASKLDIPVASIYLDSNMWAQMKQRHHDFRPMPSVAIDSDVSTPILRASTPSTPSTKGRRQTVALWPIVNSIAKGMFQDMAFAISYDDTDQKNQLSNLIHVNGGIIINDSFHDLLEGDTLQLKSPYAELGFTALLTDRHSRKEKYMQALALGLPCLSGRWIEACVSRSMLQDWQTYLLPAGESAELDNITRSRVLPPISMNNVRLEDMLALRPNLLEGATIVMVVGRGKAELKRAPYLFLIRALGAGKIHKMSDIKSAREFLDTEEGKQCRWTFVDDKDVAALEALLNEGSKTSRTSGRAQKKMATSLASAQCKVAGNELIVQSLILGKLYEG